MDQQIIHPELKAWLGRTHGGRLAKLLAFVRRREPFATTSSSTLWKLEPGGSDSDPPLGLVIKCCDHKRPSWRFMLGHAWEWREYHNLQTLDALGIAVAQPLACGQQRDRLGRVLCSVIVTESLDETRTFVQLFRDPDICVSPAARRWLVREMAVRTARMHAGGFVHHDLHWRNVLVRLPAAPDQPPQLWWIDCPRGRFVRWALLRRRGILRDLACLARTAVRQSSAAQRMRFIKHYLGPEATRDERRAWFTRIEAVRQRKWPGNAESRQEKGGSPDCEP